MVWTIAKAISTTDYSKTEPLEIQTSKHLVFQCVWYSSPHSILVIKIVKSQVDATVRSRVSTLYASHAVVRWFETQQGTIIIPTFEYVSIPN